VDGCQNRDGLIDVMRVIQSTNWRHGGVGSGKDDRIAPMFKSAHQTTSFGCWLW